MSFVRHYGVLSEPKLHNAVDTATQLARKAPQQIIDAKQLEDVLCAGHGWNRAAWTTWGCTYGGPERCGLEKELLPWGLSEQYDETREEDDGGWVVDPGIFLFDALVMV